MSLSRRFHGQMHNRNSCRAQTAPSRNLTEPQHNAPSSIRPSHRPQNGFWKITPDKISRPTFTNVSAPAGIRSPRNVT